MKIGIDLDNIVVNTTESVIEYLNERIPNLNLDIKDCKQYWLEKNLPHGYELIVQEAFESKHMWKKVKVIKGAKKYINKLREEGHEIYFVTSSLPENLRKKIKHLSRELDFFEPGYVDNHTINIRKKQLLDLDILIDDCIDNLNGGRRYTSICLNYPWNVNSPDHSIIHCDTWKEIYNEVKAIEEGEYR